MKVQISRMPTAIQGCQGKGFGILEKTLVNQTIMARWPRMPTAIAAFFQKSLANMAKTEKCIQKSLADLKETRVNKGQNDHCQFSAAILAFLA